MDNYGKLHESLLKIFYLFYAYLPILANIHNKGTPRLDDFPPLKLIHLIEINFHEFPIDKNELESIVSDDKK